MEKMRRYDMDWLRVIVFGFLIFYHVGMFFVPWGWHIKNNVIYPEMRWPMLFVNQWRLPILFVISGMGTAFALSYRSGWRFIKERFARLGIPLIIGMCIIVPPQIYFERLANGDFVGSYLAFWSGPAFEGIYPSGNFSWHHLWFLPYLLIFSLILVPLLVHLRNNPDNGFLTGLKNRVTNRPFTLYLFIIPLFLFEALLEPFFEITHNLVYDWFNFVSSLTLFFYGFLLISLKESFWGAIDKIRKYTLGIGIFSFLVLLTIWVFFEDSLVIHITEAFLKELNLWSWILTIFGYSAIYLNKESNLLKYCNQAVYPFYILHQTITITIGYFIMDLDWGFLQKFLVMIVGTFGMSWLIYEFLIRRIFFIRPLFGLKW